MKKIEFLSLFENFKDDINKLNDVIEKYYE